MEPEQPIDENYEYNCPQFVDFSVPHTIDDKADEYFDFDHEDDEGKEEQCDFMAQPDMQIPEEFEEPEPTPDGRSQEQVRGEERVSDVPHPPCSKDTEPVEHPQESTTNSLQDSVVEHENVTKDNDTGNTDHNVEHILATESTDNEKTVVEAAPIREEEDERIDQQVQDETPEVKDAEHVEEPACEEKEMTTEVESITPEAPEDGAVEEMPMDEQKTVPIVEEEDEHDTMSAQEKVSVEEETQVEEKQMEVVEETPVTRNSPESPQMEVQDTEMESSNPPAVVLSNIVTCFDHAAPAVKSAPKNLVMSWGKSNTEKTTSAKETRRSTQRSTRRSTRSLNSDVSKLKRASGSSNMQRRSLRLHNKINQSPALKKRRVSDKPQSGSRKNTPVTAAQPASKPFISKLTLPTTPTFMKRNNIKPGSQFKTTEQMEMERIASFRKQLAARKKQSQASYKKVQESSAYHAVKAVIPTTKPVGFTFETDQRIKEHPMATRQDAKPFESELRKRKTSPAKVQHGPTIPKPFKLTENRKRKLGEGEGSKHSPYRSMATRIQQFHTKTPQRYHTRRSGEQQYKDNSMQHQEDTQKPRLTCPKTPNLECRNRKRAVTVQSAAEKEEQELQEMQSYKFKAKPVNPRVMHNSNIGLKMPTHKEPTKAVGFNLESERRMKEREMKKAQEEEEQKRDEEHYEFHARPVSTKMLEGPVGIGPAHPRSLTCPKSPAFALKNRVRVKEDVIVEPEEPKSRIIHAKPILHVGVPFKPQTSHKTTEIQPFSFERRDKETQARKEAKIQDIYHEEDKARRFKAKPILEPVTMPEKKTKPATKPEPFQLANEERGAKRAEMWSKKMEEELNEQRAKANAFKAKPADVVYHEPFVPQKPNKPLTEINAFNLNTDRRAGEREGFEQWKLKKELEERESRHQQEQLKEGEERREVERMRREDMVPKAQPVKHFKPVHVLPSLRPLTDACSPHFSDRFTK